jgi:uncharacterized protein DUF222
MCSSSREGIEADFASLHEVVSRIVGHRYDALTNPERLGLLEALESQTRRLVVQGHQLINQLAERSEATELGGKLSHALSARLRITGGEAARRVAEAAELGPRRALSGEPLAPLLSATAAAQRDGQIGSGHVRVIRSFLRRLPMSVDVCTREAAESDLAEKATEFDPDYLAKLADRLTGYLNPEGSYRSKTARRGW